LTLTVCRRCGHFQLPTVDPDIQRLIYEVYYSHYEIDSLETMIPAYREPFNQMIESLAADGLLSKGRLLEIGCSSGAMIPFLTRFCSSYTGVDPSERIDLARAQYPQHTFIHSYFPSPELQGPFDVAVTQFNLEHIENAGTFVDGLAAIMRPGAVLLVQVPDAGYFLHTEQPNFLAHEHVHYFRAAQLAMLLASRGFAVERWGENGPSIICAARRSDTAIAPIEIVDPLADAIVLRELAMTVPPLPRRPVLYGVGLTLHWLLVMVPSLATEATVVDDNPSYLGKGVPGYDLLIQKPSSELFEGRDVVLTLNAIYHERVLERLRTLGASCVVHRMSEHGWTTCSL
jgi:2-polyprenyl-3-methyl-5-hydroxy-6-metoxy-1,4-benzoquinol methylase